MVQTEREYLSSLKDWLTGYVSSEDLDEILEEYAGHFSIGKSKGRTEEELCRALGPPEDVAKEIRAAYLIKKAEKTKSAGTIWEATRATTGLSGFNFVAVMVPFVLFMVIFAIVLIAGTAMIFGGAVLLLLSALKLLGFGITIPWVSVPSPGVVTSFAIFVAGIIIVMVDIWLMHFFHHVSIKHLKRNIRMDKDWGVYGQENQVPKTFVIDRDDAAALDLQVRVNAGDLVIGSGTDGQILMNMMTGNGNFAPPLSYSTSMLGTTKKVWIRNRHVSWWHEGSACEYSRSWDIRLSQDVPVALDMRSHAGRTRLALGDLNISSLSIRNGVGETQIDLAGYHGGSFDASIRNGVGNLVVRMPKECNLTLEIHRGVGDTNVRGFMVDGNTYTANAAVPGAPQITMRIHQGVGAISVEAV